MRNEWIIIKTPDTKWPEFAALLKKAGQKCPPSMRITAMVPGGENETFSEGREVSEIVRLPTIRDFRNIAASGEILEKMLAERQPAVVLFSATREGKQTAAWLAGKLKAGLTADLIDFHMDDAFRLRQIRMAFGGCFRAEIVCIGGKIQMATVKETLAERTSMIVAGGMGVSKDGFRILRELADRCGGRLGATRAAVDAGLAPFESQVGQSGSYVRPEIYMAFGISGAVQHLAGMRESGRVIAVNTDKKAPIFDYADYAVCADAETVAAGMLAQLKGEK